MFHLAVGVLYESRVLNLNTETVSNTDIPTDVKRSKGRLDTTCGIW